MWFLLFSVLSSTSISMVFKASERVHIKIFHLVVLNYFTASALGFIFSPVALPAPNQILQAPWFYMALLIGSLFIIMFIILGEATRQIGIAITTVSAKMSVIIPMSFSIVFYHEQLSTFKLLGIPLALAAVVFTVLQPRGLKIPMRLVYFPLVIFFGAGLIDSLIKYTQAAHLNADSAPIFSGILFMVAALAGVIFSIIRRQKLRDYLRPQTFLAGIVLGIVNYGSLYFLIRALDNPQFDSSILFAINHMGIVALSVLLGYILFSERLRLVNWFGIALSLAAIGLLNYA